ncbi:hypothetical protein AGMMS49974_02170 [Deltaproteobacteria bacterium]|nr:hypothetical protein AGMMS49974_02170 [Deltaproteobacteria bacterium]
MSLLGDVLDVLLTERSLDHKHKDHALTGDYKGLRECHILPDWLLIYFVYSVNLNATAQEIRNALFQLISNQSQTAFP